MKIPIVLLKRIRGITQCQIKISRQFKLYTKRYYNYLDNLNTFFICSFKALLCLNSYVSILTVSIICFYLNVI